MIGGGGNKGPANLPTDLGTDGDILQIRIAGGESAGNRRDSCPLSYGDYFRFKRHPAIVVHPFSDQLHQSFHVSVAGIVNVDNEVSMLFPHFCPAELIAF